MKTDPKDPRTIVLFGLPFHDVTMDETLAWIDHLIAQGKPSYLVTANLDFATQASEDVELHRILLEAELVVCDGTPFVWASRMTGKPLRERVAGSDLVPRLAAHAEKMGYRIYLLGGRPDILERAALNLQAKYPKLPPVKFYSPKFASLQEMDHAEIARQVVAARPDILLVAFGCPKQEKWIYMHYKKLGVPCAIGVGATIDFLAGAVSRAPRWVAAAGLEWLYRFAQEPKRLGSRYLRDIGFLIRQTWREFRVIYSANGRSAPSGEKGASDPAVVEDADVEILSWQGALTAGHIEDLPQPGFDKPFAIDLGGVAVVDSTGLGIMLRLVKKAWSSGVAACFFSPSKAVRMVVAVTKLERVLPMADDLAAARELIKNESAAQVLRGQSGDGEGVLVFQLPQRVTAENAGACAEAVRQAWERDPSRRQVVLDLAETHFIDSSGLGFLVRVHRLVNQRAGGSLRLVHVPPNVRNVIKIARLHEILLAGCES